MNQQSCNVSPQQTGDPPAGGQVRNEHGMRGHRAVERIQYQEQVLDIGHKALDYKQKIQGLRFKSI